ncbi:MAG TPA: metal ABC transporter permease, partial [Pirellulales bacterium]|nr:metal ABC transporter permease [Pirellulales bacterium]
MSAAADWLANHDLALWTIVLGAITNVACAMLGCYLVLRRMSLMGDAISHAVLPGIVIGFLWSHSLVGWGVFLGAVALGLLTASLSHGLTSYARVPEDSSMGVVFTSLFALGVFLLTNLARNVDLDPGCVLYGLIEAAPLDTVSCWGVEIPRTLAPMLAALTLTCAFVVLFWKELKLSSFDPALATVMGLRANVVHYLLMAMVAIVTVASFEAVGSIIVIAMLVVPAATAHLLTDRLRSMMLVSVGVAVVSSVFGYW